MNLCGFAFQACPPTEQRLLKSNAMITPRGMFRLLGVSTFLLLGSIFPASSVDGAENRRQPSRSADSTRVKEGQIPLQHARIRARQVDADAGAVSNRRSSMVAQAAHGQVMAQPPDSPLDGSLVQGKVRPVGFLETYQGGCGPVCDCGQCDPGCGIEPVCGTEYYADQPACGFEVGCGIGAALTKLGPRVCGVEGCTDCCESVCGVEGVLVEGPGCGMETVGDCSCDACVGGCDFGQLPICLPFLRINWNRYQFFVGTQGFKGPLNFANTNANNNNVRSGSGSFGFYQGFNMGHSLKRWYCCDLAAQCGLRATQSNLSGSQFTRETRHQVFLTAGLFRRVDCGLQYGAVVDYLNSDWYFQGDLTQLRSELSWKTQGCHVYGFQSMARLGKDSSTTFVDDGAGNIVVGSIRFESTTQYRFFYRRLLNNAGRWDAFAGFTDNDDGLLGTLMNLPLRRNLVLQTGATYLIPREGDSSGGHREESWNIGLGLVYRPGGPMGPGRYARPMFDVADNGTFMVDFR